MIALLLREKLPALRVQHGGLQREIDGFAAAGRAKTLRQLPRREFREQLRKVGPRRIQAGRRHVARSLEAPQLCATLVIAPAEIADAPARGEIDVAPAVRIENVTALRTGDLEI